MVAAVVVVVGLLQGDFPERARQLHTFSPSSSMSIAICHSSKHKHVPTRFTET